MTIIDTARLRLWPRHAADTPDLHELVKDLRIGLACGWAPRTSIEDAHQALSTVLSSPETYAVTQINGGEFVGAIGLRVDNSDVPGVVDLGYWIGSSYWGRGYATEAGAVIVERVKALGMMMLTLGYFDGNEAPRRVAEELHFSRTERDDDVEFPLINRYHSLHRMALQLASWQLREPTQRAQLKPRSAAMTLQPPHTSVGDAWRTRLASRSWRRRSVASGLIWSMVSQICSLSARCSGVPESRAMTEQTTVLMRR